MFEKFKAQPAFRYGRVKIFLTQRFLTIFSIQMLNIAVSQYVYEVSRSPYYLAYVGLTLFLPKFLLSPITGFVADHFERRRIILLCRVLRAFVAIGLVLSVLVQSSLLWVYCLLLLQGIANAFDGPATQAYVPQLVPREDFANVATWNSFFFQVGAVLGPVMGGWIYGFLGPAEVFAAVLLCSLVAFALVLRIDVHSQPNREGKLSLTGVLAGLHYVRQQPVLLGALSLDLFAVLFGGVVALLPIYANEIYNVGATGLGYLRAAPGFGAMLVGFFLAQIPKKFQSGRVMMTCVALFGVCTIAFAISKTFWIALPFLILLGAFDMVSVVIRSIMVQLETPDILRGRVSAVNMIFIGASNELGEFESGVTAGWFGVVPAAVLGGCLTLLVTGVWKKMFPALWDYQHSEDAK